MALDDIKVLLRVVELGSVQGAAKHLGIPRSTRRRRRRDLEACVGGDLLVADTAGKRSSAASDRIPFAAGAS